MAENARIEITTLDRIDGDEVVVGFSDGTLVTYTVEELLTLRPNRVQASVEGADEPATGA